MIGHSLHFTLMQEYFPPLFVEEVPVTLDQLDRQLTDLKFPPLNKTLAKQKFVPHQRKFILAGFKTVEKQKTIFQEFWHVHCFCFLSTTNFDTSFRVTIH